MTQGEAVEQDEYLVGVIEVEKPTPRLVDILVAGFTTAHCQRGVHVDVMTSQIERDEALEDDGPSWKGRR